MRVKRVEDGPWIPDGPIPFRELPQQFRHKRQKIKLRKYYHRTTFLQLDFSSLSSLRNYWDLGEMTLILHTWAPPGPWII